MNKWCADRNGQWTYIDSATTFMWLHVGAAISGQNERTLTRACVPRHVPIENTQDRISVLHRKFVWEYKSKFEMNLKFIRFWLCGIDVKWTILEREMIPIPIISKQIVGTWIFANVYFDRHARVRMLEKGSSRNHCSCDVNHSNWFYWKYVFEYGYAMGYGVRIRYFWVSYEQKWLHLLVVAKM